MVISRFEQLLKDANPKLHIRVRGNINNSQDVLGLFGGPHYIARMTAGELQRNGYRYQVVDPNNPMVMVNGNIQKRGRKHLLNILYNHRWITYFDRTRILNGIERGTKYAKD